MSRADEYAAAMLPDVWRVAGVRLHVPTLGHILLLQRLGLPAVASALASPLPAGTMALWLWVMSRPWDKATAGLRTWRGRWWVRVVAWQLRRRTDDDHLALVASYLSAAWSGPEIWEKEATGRTLCAPLAQNLKLILMSRLGVSEKAALDTPVRVALWDAAALAESSGQAEWVDESIAAAIEAQQAAHRLAGPGGQQHEQQPGHEQTQSRPHDPQGDPTHDNDATPHVGTVAAD